MLVSYLLPLPRLLGVSSSSLLPSLLERTLKSIITQTTPNWELVIICHPRHLERLKKIQFNLDPESSNFHALGKGQTQAVVRHSKFQIVVAGHSHAADALNDGLQHSKGKWIASVQLGNTIASHSAYEITRINFEYPNAKLIYSNHDCLGLNGKRISPFYKPSFSPDLLFCQNYFGDLVFYHRKLLNQVGGWDPQFKLAYQYELALRSVKALLSSRACHLLSKPTQSAIVHTPQFLSHQCSENYGHHSPNNAIRDSKHQARLSRDELRALKKNIGNKADIIIVKPGIFRPLWHLTAYQPQPLVSIIIPTHNGLEVLKPCIEAILKKTTYAHYEIIIIDNRSNDPATIRYLGSLRKQYHHISIVAYRYPFNYSAINNFAVKKAKGSVLCLLNNDTEVITPDWLDIMVSHALQPYIACVGAMLYYPDGSIQHAGTIVGLNGVADHAFKGLRKTQKNNYFSYLDSIRNPKAVTAAALVIQKHIFERLGGFDAQKLKVAFNDVDLCLKAMDAGFFNVWLPHVELTHHESKSRKHESISHLKKFAREEFEQKVLNKRYDLDNYYHTQYD